MMVRKLTVASHLVVLPPRVVILLIWVPAMSDYSVLLPQGSFLARNTSFTRLAERKRKPGAAQPQVKG